MEKKPASSLFVNDGSFMERFKQLQQDKESSSEPTLSGPTKPKPDISNSGSKASASFKINKPPSGKLAFSLKQKSKLVTPAVKLSEDDDEDERNDGNSSGDGPIKRQKVDRFDASELSLKQVIVGNYILYIILRYFFSLIILQGIRECFRSDLFFRKRVSH
ncbi:putative SURP and G-patch domain-containing protein [Helianthus annuus]|nr:putative SURP and G-patch domain-containing protein [Helianthus annuus]